MKIEILRLIFGLMFLLSMILLRINVTDWIIINVIINWLWNSMQTNKITFELKLSNKENILSNFNKSMSLLVVIPVLIIAFLSTSFFIRIIMAHLYQGIALITIVTFIISMIINIMIWSKLLKVRKKLINWKLILSIIVYPIGVLLIENEYNKIEKTANKA
ncbi:hypothetical protein [Aureivirga sp. CE67]|uniref:hypothetical protein n=1 Tax=Aureivirga sp. CE67 TaxID=1788983 RepID=UPI0018CB005A|nr:hypothetical protein [Aureivirga sp. CE67]